MALSSHANVNNSCLLILRRRGWELSLEGERDEYGSYIPESLWWTAVKNDYRLGAYNPIELLGLAAIYDFKQPSGPPESYWWVVDGPNVFGELIDKTFPDDDEIVPQGDAQQ